MTNLKLGDRFRYTDERWEDIKRNFTTQINGPFIITGFWGGDAETGSVGGVNTNHDSCSGLGSNFSSYYTSVVKINRKPTVILYD